jgi:hypothetical protein
MAEYHGTEQRKDRLGRIEHVLGELTKAHADLAHRQSLRKNGESWKAYLGKVFTVDRILLLIVLIYQLGGQVKSYTSQLEGLVKREEAVLDQQRTLTTQIAAQRGLVEEQGELVMGLMNETARLEQARRQLDDRISRTVTRQEFKAAIEERILPRLDRIEKAQ